MIIEFIGSTGTGKTTLISQVHRRLAKTAKATTCYDLVAAPLGLGGVTHPIARTLIQDLVGLPFFFRSLYEHRAFIRFALKTLARHERYTAFTANYLRSIVRRIGTYEIIKRCKRDRIVLVDEGTVMSAQLLFVYTSTIYSQDDIEKFASLVPLPDLLVYLRAPVETLVQRSLQRTDVREMRSKNQMLVEKYISRAEEMFDRLTEKKGIRDRMVIVANADSTEGERSAVADRIASFIVKHQRVATRFPQRDSSLFCSLAGQTPMSSPGIPLPNFLVIGGSKCGTHWLNECLREHPDVYLTRDVHEIFFFDRYFDRGVEWYAGYFRGYSGQERIGDITPTYLAHPLAPERIYRTLPAATLIVSLRNPVQRARSKYLHMWRKGEIRPNTSFRSACAIAPEIIRDGEYARCLTAWRRYFRPHQMHYLILDDALSDPVAFTQSVYSILHVDERFEATTATQRTNIHQTPRSLFLARIVFRTLDVLHGRGLHGIVQFAKRVGIRDLVLKPSADERKDPPPLSAEDRKWLIEHYQDDVAQLSDLTNRNLVDLWLRNNA